jgi:2-hydroxy-3-keto-5-methylthiopentenyl-1-phosphate phosphatase
VSHPLPDPPRTPPATPVPVPPLVAGEPPLAILVDYDGTIARTDVSDAILSEFITGDWVAYAADYDAGLVGSRRLMAFEVSLIRDDAASLMAKAAAQPHDEGFRPFAERALAAGIPVEVVSDGYGFFIEPALRALGLGRLPVVTALTTFGPDGVRIEFPHGDPRCFVCGTCKRNRVLAHQAAGRAVAFIGDGRSDRYAAGYADVVFAKDALQDVCLERGWPFEPWTSFAGIHAWLDGRLEAFAADPATLPGPRARPMFCGAEVWGPDRFDPPAPAPPGEGLVPG